MGTRDLCRVPKQRYTTGEQGKFQGRDHVGIVEISYGYRARVVNVEGKIVLSRNPGYQTRGVTMWLKADLTRGYCCRIFPAGDQYWGDLCRVPPTAVHHGRARQSSGTGPCGYCRRFLWVAGPRGQYSGKIHFIEKPGVRDEWCRQVAKRSSDPRVAFPEV